MKIGGTVGGGDMKRNSIMYKNLRAEMARKGLTILDIAKEIGMNRETLSRKLSGKSPLHIQEAFDIQKKCFPDMDVQTLFEECTA